jgi:hypothetical protein
MAQTTDRVHTSAGAASDGLTYLLAEGNRLAAEGNQAGAYQHSLEATKLAPRNPHAWYFRSQVAASVEEQLFCLSRAFSLEPDFPHGRNRLYQALKGMLSVEPSISYLAETDALYQVRSGHDVLLHIPKNRSAHTPYPQQQPGPDRPAVRWLNAAALGFLLGGVGAFVLAPIAAFSALSLQFKQRSGRDRIRLLMVFVLAVLLWVASLPLTVLFALHFLR